MRHSSIFGNVILLFLLLSGHTACSQSVQPPTHDGPASASGKTTNDLPVGIFHTRPKLSLQNALKAAEGYLVKAHVNAASYWVYEAKFGQYGANTTADKDKIPGWYFSWVNDEGSPRDHIEIFVSMDGKAMRLPSM
jgi:hypothetical protein